MLTSLLDTIKSQFTSKSYWLGSMMPLLLFLFANYLMLLKHSQSMSARLLKAESLTQGAFQYGAILAVILAFAYALSAIDSLMLGLLEGNHLGIFGGLFYRTQWRKLADLDEAYKEAVLDQRIIRKAQKEWEDKLYGSRLVGAMGRKQMTWGPWVRLWFGVKSFTPRLELAELRFRQRHGLRASPRLLDAVVSAVAAWLIEYHAEAHRGKTLDAAHNDVIDAIQYALDRSQFELVRLLNKRQFHFPGNRPSAADCEPGPSTNSILAPTKMGNIGRTMRSYALIRYQLDLDIFWTRLQSAMQKDGGEFFKNLQDTKAQVDCMVTLVWLTAIFTLYWTVALLRIYPNSTETEFRIVSIGGAILTWAWYEMSCESYRVFADVMRSSVDLFRFKMLELLHMQPPYGSEEERELWVRLGNSAGYGRHEQFTYKNV
jgi:hypothetical protein